MSFFSRPGFSLLTKWYHSTGYTQTSVWGIRLGFQWEIDATLLDKHLQCIEPSLDDVISSPSLPFAHIYSTLNGLICLYSRTTQYDPNIISTHMIIQVWKLGMLVILLTVPHSQGLKHQKNPKKTKQGNTQENVPQWKMWWKRKSVDDTHHPPKVKAEWNQACLDLDSSQSNIRKCFFK